MAFFGRFFATLAANKIPERVMNLASKMPEKVSGFAARLQDQATIAAKQLPDKASSVASKLQTQANSWKGPIVYNAKVARELIKEFYVRHDLRPPQRFELDEAKKEVKQLFSFFRSGQFLNMKVREAIQKGLIGVEILGFFFIGEIIGKRKLFGYKDYESSVSTGHH